MIAGYAAATWICTVAVGSARPWMLSAWLPLSLAGLMVLVACTTRGRAARGALIGSMVCVSCAWWGVRIGPVSQGRDDAASLPERAIVRFEGVVAGRVEAQARGFAAPGTAWSFPVRVERLDGVERRWRAGDIVRVRCEGRVGIAPGDRVRIAGEFAGISGPLNPGERDARVRAAQDRVIGRVATTGGLVERLGEAAGLRAWVDRVRERLRDRADAALGGGRGERHRTVGVALARSLILGEDDGAVLEDARESFTRVGLSHILAISGFHLVVLVWTVVVLVRLFGDRGALEPMVVGAMVAAYALVVPAEAPVVRASVMVLAFLIGDAFGRRHDRLAVLGWVACGLLIWKPADAWSLGFQLSIGLTGVLLWMGTRMNERVWGPVLRGTVTSADPTIGSMIADRAKSLVSASVLCWAVGLPLIAWHTGSVSVLAVPATLVAVPLCVVLMWLGFVALVGGMIWAPIGASLLPALSGVGSFVAEVVLWFDESGVSLARVGSFSAFLGAAATGLVLWWCWSGRWRSGPHWIATGLVVAWGAIELRAFAGVAPDVRVRIDTLAVGDGACHIVRAGGEAMLWDCGSLARQDVGARSLPRAARALGLTRIRTAVLTHPNVDHWNGLVDAARTMGVRVVLVGEATLAEAASERGERLRDAMRAMERRGVVIRRVGAGDSFALGGVNVAFVWPPEGFAASASNEHSLVASVGGEGERADLLLTGDIQEEAIAGVMAAHPGLRTRVMELPHHGSMIRATVDLVASLEARAIHQSTGERRARDARMERWRGEFAGRWGVTARDGWLWTEVTRGGAVRGGSMRE